MENYLTCKKAASLLSIYIDGKLSGELKEKLELHLMKCPACFEKYKQMKNILENLKISYEKMIRDFDEIESTRIFNIREYEKFKNNISAYLDNELSSEESLDFRKFLFKSKAAREELNSYYDIQNSMKEAFQEQMNGIHINVSRNVINRLKRKNNVYSYPYQKVAIITGLVIFIGSAGVFYNYEAKIHHKQQLKLPKIEMFKKLSILNPFQNFYNTD